MRARYHAFSTHQRESALAAVLRARHDERMIDGLRALRDSVIPERCAFCGIHTAASEGPVCGPCAADLPYAPPRPPPAPLTCEVVPFAYEFPVDAAIKALKFRRKLFYGRALAQLLCACCDALPDDIDAIVPVPLHWRRQWYRGFNQALEIAGPVARHLGVPIAHPLRRRRATPSKSGLSALARARNLRGAFVAHEQVRCRHALIVDDVITTGATVQQVARTLLAAGVEKVSALAVARA